MPVTIKEIAWVAGLLEGEGYFQLAGVTPRITLKMTDADIVERFKTVINCKASVYHKTRKDQNAKWKDIYEFHVSVNESIQWMMTIYPLMGIRRKAKIREIITVWKNHTNNSKESVMKHKFRSFGISEYDIEIFMEKMKNKQREKVNE